MAEERLFVQGNNRDVGQVNWSPRICEGAFPPHLPQKARLQTLSVAIGLYTTITVAPPISPMAS